MTRDCSSQRIGRLPSMYTHTAEPSIFFSSLEQQHSRCNARQTWADRGPEGEGGGRRGRRIQLLLALSYLTIDHASPYPPLPSPLPSANSILQPPSDSPRCFRHPCAWSTKIAWTGPRRHEVRLLPSRKLQFRCWARSGS